MKNTFAVWSVLACAVARGQQAPVATLPGSVISEDSTLIPGASVSYQRASKYRAVARDAHRVSWELAEPHVRGTVTTATGGSFALSALPDGAYLICVDVPAGGYLDPCVWGRGIGFTVALGRATPVAPIVLKRGAILRIRINDPAHLLPPPNVVSISKLITGVKTATGGFYPATLVSADPGGRDLLITVPYATPLKFWIFSRQVNVTDAAGSAVDTSGIDMPFSIAIGTVPPARVFNVTGVK